MTNKPNPHRPGTEAWHVHNLGGATWGHIVRTLEAYWGLEIVGYVYGDTTFLFDPQKTANDVRTLYPGQARLLDMPVELMDDDEWNEVL